MSAEPLTQLGQLAAMLREFYQSLIQAGFSEYQACLILGTQLAQNGRGGIEGTE